MAVLLGGNVYGQDSRKTVAVIPTTGTGVIQSIKDGVTERLLEGVVKSRQFRPVARDKDFEQALSKVKFQQSGFIDDNQLVQLGKTLRADYVCYASVNKYSEKGYYINYKMIDVATAEIVDIDSETVREGVDELLTVTDNIAAKLFGGSSEAAVGTTQSSWSSELGRVSFATDKIWTVGLQTWSDAVQTTGCSNKKTYDDSKADCRSNPGYNGDLFSWRAVDKYKNQLCPSGWRVPTQQDFIDLDKALGGTGYYQIRAIHHNKYLNDWGGAYGGRCYSGGSLTDQGSYAYYWSQSEFDSVDEFGYGLNFSDGIVSPQHNSNKYHGFALRCVR